MDATSEFPTLLVLVLTLLLLVGIAAYFITIAVCEWFARRQLHRQVSQRLLAFSNADTPERAPVRLYRWLNTQLSKTSLGRWIDGLVYSADLQWSGLTVLFLWLLLYAALFAALLLLLQLGGGANLVLSGLAATGLAVFYFITRKDAYEKALQAQTPEIAQLISNSLRAGQSLYFAFQEIEQKLPRPAQREFRSLRLQIDVGGLSIDESMRNFLRDHPSEEMRILITALLVQRRAGGDLISALANISKAIFARRRIRNEIDTITAQARQTSLISIVLPFVILVILNQVSPGMVAEFINWPPGLVFFIIVYAVPQTIAFLLIRRMGDVQV